MLQDADALPQLIGEYKPLDQWQTHLNQLFYGLRGDKLRSYYQTFASADFRLAHALAADYYERVAKREKTGSRPPSFSDRLTILELGPGNGNLAACFLSHLNALDRQRAIYPRVRYIMVDWEQPVLDGALAHADLAGHRDRVDTHCGSIDHIAGVADGTIDRIICNELWNDLPTKLLAKQGGEVEEEYIRPNLSETLHATIQDWSAFVRAFQAKDLGVLETFPPFLDELVWEKEYRKVEWKDIPYRKTIVEFLQGIDQEVVVPVNVGAFATLKEAKRLLAPDAIGFSAFDAGTADMNVLNDPEKPCYGQFGGQYSFMINFALVEAVAKHLGMNKTSLEPQREFVGRSLNTNAITLMELLATHPSAGPKLQSWEQDRLVLKTIKALNETFESPYRRRLEFPLGTNIPPDERETLGAILRMLKENGIPDTVAYLTEDELTHAQKELEDLGYEHEAIKMALSAPPSPIEYCHFACR
ncbi:MAG: SAM-dependent methyltransferase [Nitrospira sp.]|nr:SAM-dependent methyltransferase [Nitrospira sp.]MDH4370227.1 SAM-dependent methyltransferase [Nitrospira sp.]MDH5346508.1 SAM-dependent methyltransferase [Nitrospira sp.]MDH5496310.1 SAM-dependent methyltransferase [Nitrospira sp.]MDH5723839.1 SAM-dependent methyltransferase [Nitrospira sp.]